MDKTLTCRYCGTSIVWTAGEQEFYASRGLLNEPGRCPSCRSARKAQRAGAGVGGGYGGSSYGSERPVREMFTATCSSCGGEARIPFQPRTDKPVYCSDCFQSRGGGGRSGGDRW
ncbi:MAG: zinc-ribbon domain containing protein [Chloroflexi bacterium]|nr:zinc-ribbon domain containing protein [Chloroflexota bacterium]